MAELPDKSRFILTSSAVPSLSFHENRPFYLQIPGVRASSEDCADRLPLCHETCPPIPSSLDLTMNAATGLHAIASFE